MSAAAPRSVAEPLLEVHDLEVAYDAAHALWGVTIEVRGGELELAVGAGLSLCTRSSAKGNAYDTHILARSGACFMAGGAFDVVPVVEPVFRDLAVEGGCLRFQELR